MYGLISLIFAIAGLMSKNLEALKIAGLFAIADSILALKFFKK